MGTLANSEDADEMLLFFLRVYSVVPRARHCGNQAILPSMCLKNAPNTSKICLFFSLFITISILSVTQ